MLKGSCDGGTAWETIAVLEPRSNLSNCYPSVVVTTSDTIVKAYSVYFENVPRIGIKVAMLKKQL